MGLNDETPAPQSGVFRLRSLLVQGVLARTYSFFQETADHLWSCGDVRLIATRTLDREQKPVLKPDVGAVRGCG
jgi:hypothetical protein